MGSEELENILIRPQGMAFKRPGTEYIASLYDGYEYIAEVPEIPAVATYELTFISENRKIWGIPVGNGEMLGGLDAAGVAVDIGGGVVGLPYTGHPFTAGEVVRITGTTGYGGEHTLLAGTTANQLQFTDSYFAETFDGTEIVVQYMNMPSASSGRMDIDADGNLYHGHGWYAAGSCFITKIEPDGTQVYDYFEDTGATTANLVNGIKINSASTYLYMLLDRGGLAKFELATGDLEWSVATGATSPGKYMVLDSEDNVYFRGGTTDKITKYSSVDGSVVTEYTDTTSTYAAYAVAVDEDIGDGIVVSGGLKVAADDDATLWNLTVRELSNSSGKSMALGGTYENGALWYTYIIGTGAILTHDGYIYVIASTPTCTLYKIEVIWENDVITDLTIVKEVAGPTSGCGLYVDLYGNIVVVNQDASATKDDVLWFYDTDLNYLSKISGMYGMLATWVSAVGGAWIQGDACFDGTITDGTPAVSEITYGNAIAAGTWIGANSVCVIPGTTEDEVWITVTRSIDGVLQRFVERFKPRDWGDDQEDCFFVDSGLTYDGDPDSTFSGLDHLEGETVAILGDGAVFPTQTVTNGSVTLPETVSVCHVGLPFKYIAKPMRFDQSYNGTSKGSIKKTAEVVISFYKTLNAQHSDGVHDPIDIKWRTTEEFTTPPSLHTGDKVVNTDGGFDVEDPFQVEGSDPLPCTIRAIIPRLDITGR